MHAPRQLIKPQCLCDTMYTHKCRSTRASCLMRFRTHTHTRLCNTRRKRPLSAQKNRHPTDDRTGQFNDIIRASGILISIFCNKPHIDTRLGAHMNIQYSTHDTTPQAHVVCGMCIMLCVPVSTTHTHRDGRATDTIKDSIKIHTCVRACALLCA